MLTWWPLAQPLLSAVQGDAFWEPYLTALQMVETLPFTIHLAILVEPYLQFILEGRKTVESRFSAKRCAPYERVRPGDVILLKRSSGPIVGLCQVAHAWFYTLDASTWTFIQERFAEAICAQDLAFWDDRAHTSFATLMRIDRVRSIAPIEYSKRDRRGWVALSDPPQYEQLKIKDL